MAHEFMSLTEPDNVFLYSHQPPTPENFRISYTVFCFRRIKSCYLSKPLINIILSVLCDYSYSSSACYMFSQHHSIYVISDHINWTLQIFNLAVFCIILSLSSILPQPFTDTPFTVFPYGMTIVSASQIITSE
jgi:hypothetical protein